MNGFTITQNVLFFQHVFLLGSGFLIPLLLYGFIFTYSYLDNLLENVKKNFPKINYNIVTFFTYNFQLFCILVIINQGLNFSSFVENEEGPVHIILYPITILIFLGFDFVRPLVEKIAFTRFKLVFFPLVIVNINNILPFLFLENLASICENSLFLREEEQFFTPEIFDNQLGFYLILFIIKFYYFLSALSFKEQGFLLIPGGLGIYKLLSLAEVNDFLFSQYEKKGEKAELVQSGFLDPFFKELLLASKPINTTVETVTQKALIISGDDLGGEKFKDAFLEECETLKIVEKTQEDLKVKKPSFVSIFTVNSSNKITDINLSHEKINKFSQQEIQKEIAQINQVKNILGYPAYENNIRMSSQIRPNEELPIHLSRANISDNLAVYKVQGLLNIILNNDFKKDVVESASQDNAIGVGGINSAGMSNAIPLILSAVDSADVLAKTHLKEAKVIGGGNIYKGDVVIEHEGGILHMEIKDILVDTILDEDKYKDSLFDKIENSQAETVMFKAPYLANEETKSQLCEIIKKISKNKNKNIFLLTPNKIIKITPQGIHDEKELPI